MSFFSHKADAEIAVQLPVTPIVGTRVRIVGESGMFLVVRVDARRYLADVIRMDKTARVEEGIHFSLIHALPEPRAFRPDLWHRAAVFSLEAA